MSSELDDFLRRRDQQAQGTTRVLVEAAGGMSPEQAARAANYRRKYGLPAPYEKTPQLETDEHVEEALAAVQRDPTVAKWLARDRGNAALGRGGLTNLADTSEAIGTAAPAREKSWMERAKNLLLNSTSTTLPGLVVRGARAVGTARAAAEDLTPGNIGRALGAGVAGAASGFAGTVEAGAELAERYSPSAVAARELFGVDTGTGWVGDLARQRRQGWEKLADETRPDAKTEEGKGVLSGVESMPLSIGALVTGAFSGGATTAAALMGAAVGGQSYGRARDYGLSVEQSSLYGAIDAGIELGTERLTFLKALDVGTPFAKRFAQTLFTENLGEQFATLGQDFNEWANISSNEGKTFGDFLNERPDAAYQTAIAATLMAGTLTPTVSAIEYGMNRVGRTLARTAYTEDTRRFAQSLGDLTKASVVLQRDRGSFEEFVRDAAEGTEATTVYVEAEQLQNVLNQSDLTVDDAFDMTGMTPEQLTEAVERGEDVAIPIEEYAARIASSPVGDKLLDHLRLDPDDMSAEQAKVYLQSVKEELAATTEQAAVEGEARSERQASRAAVEGRILADLQTARRFTDDVNETYASLVGAFYETQSAKLGMSADEMFTRYPLRVQSGEVAQPTYDQATDPFEDTSKLLERDDWAVLTAENPNAQRLSVEENAARNEQLRARLREMGLSFREVKGKYGNDENSIAVSGITREQAMALGNEFEQESVLTRDGLVYGDGTVNPAQGMAEDAETREDFFSTLDDGRRFSIDIDFDQRLRLDGAVVVDDPAFVKELADKADAELQGPAAAAIDTFVGMGPGAIDAGVWGGLMNARALEAAFEPDADPAVREALEEVFAPVREQLRAKFGDRVRLYRRQGAVETEDGVEYMSRGSDGTRRVLSWTSDRKVAEWFAGLRGKDAVEYTEEEIVAAEATFAETGTVKLQRGYELRSSQIEVPVPGSGPQGVFPYNYPEQFEWTTAESIDIYHRGENITDTDSVRAFMERHNEEARETNADRDAKRADVIEASVPLDRVVWVTDRAGQMEFIVRNEEEARPFVDQTGALFNQSAAPLQTLPMGVEGTGPGGRVRNWDVGEAFTLRHMAKYGRALDPTDPEDYQIALQSLLEDYADQKAQPDNGEAWYSDDIAEALRITQAILPEIEDPVRRDIFLTAVALLSPQQGPIDNWGNAIVAMTGYSIDGRFALRHPDGMEFGVKSHSTGLALFEHLINEYGEIGALVWINSEHTGAEMEAVRRASGLFLNKADNYLPKETNKTESKLGVYVFGPKVGDFMLNSAGLDQNAVTVDLWMARTYNRVIGRLTDVNEKRAAEGGLADAMRGKAERAIVKQLVRDAAAEAGIAPSAMQAALWYFEQRLYRNHGIQSESTSFSDAAREAALRRGIDVSGAPAAGSAQRSAEDARRDLEEGVRVYDQSGLNPQTAFARESFEPTIAVRHADGTVYADLLVGNDERQAKVADALGAKAVVRVAKDDPRLQEGVPLWFTRPPLNADGTITIHHWGPEGVTETDPSRWGESNSLPKSERAAIGSSLPRTYFGIASGQPGGYRIEFPGRNQYEARVPADKLYDIAADPDGLKQNDGVPALERRIKAAGYLGYWSNNRQLGLVATVFEPVAVRPAQAQVFHQDAVFFSALERTLEKTATNKASAQQWKATLEKTPGIKEDELNWTGLLEFLSMAEDGALSMGAPVEEMDGKWWVTFGPEGMVQAFDDKEEAFAFARQHRTPAKKGAITREQLLEVVRGAGLRVDEVVKSARPQDNQYGPTQFSSWSSDPGNETYRELLITLPIGEGRNPNRAPSTHWDTDGVIAHARFMDKTDADGKRVLFIEEVQSDWHQKGRDQGYETKAEDDPAVQAARARVAAAIEEARELNDAWNDESALIAEGRGGDPALEADLLFRRNAARQRRDLAARELIVAEGAASRGIPNAPFRTDWPALVMKRMIRWAAEHGYERIAWTTGEQQAERYNLSKHIEAIKVQRTTNSTEGAARYVVATYRMEGAGILNSEVHTAEGVRELLGADLGGRAIAAADEADGTQVSFEGLDLRIGGEGMKAFYDRNLVNITNKLVKKYGAKVGLIDVVDARSERAAADDPAVMAANLDVNDISARTGILSTQSMDALEKRDAAVALARQAAQPGFDITPELADAAMGGFPLFQRDRAPRGQIAMTASLDQSTITLLRGADLSTFVHELGHFFFEVTNHMADQAGAPAQIVADRDAMLRYLGVESATEWANRTPAQRREGHERMARSFEAFLFEGRAPSLELRPLFGRLRNWMVQVYRTITRLDVELTDEVRGAFTRMLASDEAIAEAEADQGLRPLFDAKPEGMSDSDWEEYQQLDQDARGEAAIQLESRSLRDMRFAGKAVAREIKRLQREVADQRAAVREEVEAELSETPVYQAIAELRSKDGIKINTGILRELLQLDDAPLPDAMRGMTNQDGTHPQQVADLFGFSSADHLLRELLFASPLADAVEAETDQRMRERYGDLNTPEEVEEAARAAVHNEVRGRFVATELAALQKAPGKKRVLAAAAKRLAEDMVARLRIRDLRPGQYEAAERRAAKAAQTAGTTDIDEMVRHKRNQLLQFNLAKAAHEARDEMRKAREYLTKFGVKGTRANIDPDYLDQIDQLLERYELRQISNREADRRKSLTEWIEKMRAEGFEPAIDPETLAEIGRKNWRDLTVEEMRGLLDAVRNIEHLGRLTKKLLTAKDKADLDTAAAEMGEAVRNNATRTVDLPVGAKTWWESVKSGAADFLAMHRKIANLAYVFDGNQYGGVFWERFIRPMNERGDWQAKRNREANEQLAELFKPIAREDTTTRRFEPAIGRSISLEDRIMVALNMGNEANLQRLMSGDRWEYDQVLAVVAPLEAHHWDFVENVWRHLDSYRPEIAAKERRVSGVEPEWVEAVPFQIEIDGQLRLISGGYFPIKYDPDKNSKANADEASEVLKQMTRGLYSNSQTRRGHTKARVDAVNNRPLKKTFGVVFGHVNQVIHDLAWHEYLIDANRLLKHGAVDSAIREHHGPEVLRWMGKALEDIAIGDIPAQNAFEKSVRHLRTGVSIAAMGWSVWTSLLQPTGLTQSMSRIGSRWVFKGIGDWIGNPAKANAKLEWVREQSSFMRERGDTMQREISEIRNRIGAKSPLRGAIGKVVPEGVSSAMADSYFYMIQKAQLIADMPTWLGQYEKSMAGGEQHERAVAIADQAVIDSQGGGTTKDLAGIQRGSELMKLFTNFYSYFSATFNLMADRTTQMKRVGPRDLPYYAIDMMLLSVVPATIASVMYQLLKGDEDDDWGDWLAQIAQDNLVYMLGLMVGVREIGSALAGVAGYTGPAGARFFSETGRFGKQVAQGEIDEPLLRAGNSMAGILFHYPATQLDRSVRGTIQYAEGDAGLQAPIVGPPPQ